MRPQFLLAALTALASSACYSAGDGQAPPLDQLYFPTGLALDTSAVNARGEPRYLYVASSDFDLQYRSSGLISFDLDAIADAGPRNCAIDDDCKLPGEMISSRRCDTPEGVRADLVDEPAAFFDSYVPSYVCVPKGDTQPCGAAGEQSAASRLLYPSRCNAFDQHPFIHSTVGIGAFATDVIFKANPTPAPGESTARLFLPVRGDATLHWIDLEDGFLKCDQGTTDDGSCGASHRAGHNPSDSNANFSQPAEPFGIAISDDGKYVGMTNQTSGSVSLYEHDWALDVNPELKSIVYGLPQAPVAIAAVPQFPDPTNAFAPGAGFLVAYRNAAQVDLLRVLDDARFELTYAGSAPISVNSLGYDSRDIVIDDPRPDACEKALDYAACLKSKPQPDVYIANRTPSSLLVGSMRADASYASGSSDLPAFTDSIQVTTGPSRLVLGSVRVAGEGNIDVSGNKFALERRVFIVCFDSTRIFVYDPKRHAIESVIDTGRGPYSLAVDDKRGLAYVGYFTDSYLGVISLDQRYPKTYAAVIANIGIPTPPRSSK